MSSIKSLFKEKIEVINIGLPSFAEDLRDQGVPVVHIDWHPPAGGNVKILRLLERIEKWQSALKSSEHGGE